MGNIYNMNQYTIWNAYWFRYRMPNCVAYTFGRFNELNHETSLNSKWPTGDGYQWFLQAPGKNLQTGQVPQLGACACWYYESLDNPGTPTGHTAIVEEIQYDSNNQWISFTTSNSAWYRSDPNDDYSDIGTPAEGFPYFYIRTIYKSSIDYVPDHPEAYFQGFVYHPQFPPGGVIPSMGFGAFLVTILTGGRDSAIKILKKRRR